MSETPFWKYHGLGNDFVLVDRRGLPNISPEQTRAICDRHRGIGADGILGLYEADGAPRMRVFNADGSIADMCGNGLRCFVRWLIDTQGWPVAPFTVATDAGPQTCIPIESGGQVERVRINLGAPRIVGHAEVQAVDRPYEGTDLFLGNPHYVINRAAEPAEAGCYGPALSTHEHFPNDTNVEWLEVLDRRTANMVVYERGVGVTQACGTGGGAAAVVAVYLGLMDAAVPLSLTLPGGELMYEVSASLSDVWMTGPAEPVFQGTLGLALR